MKKFKHLILPLLASVATVIGSCISASKAKELLIFDLFTQDKLLHFGCYFVLTILWSYGLTRINAKKGISKALVITIVLGFVLEVCQYLFFEGRLFEILDIIANISGSLIGALVFMKFNKL